MGGRRILLGMKALVLGGAAFALACSGGGGGGTSGGGPTPGFSISLSSQSALISEGQNGSVNVAVNGTGASVSPSRVRPRG